MGRKILTLAASLILLGSTTIRHQRAKNSIMSDSAKLILVDQIEPLILTIRGQKVLLDRDLASLYGVSTKALNQGVKRNRERFPRDFLFQLSAEEKQEVVTNCDHLAKLTQRSMNQIKVRVPPKAVQQGIARIL